MYTIRVENAGINTVACSLYYSLYYGAASDLAQVYLGEYKTVDEAVTAREEHSKTGLCWDGVS